MWLCAGEELPPLGQSPNLFLETLTHRSSWVMKRGRRGESHLNRQGSSVNLRNDDLHTLDEDSSAASSSLTEDMPLSEGGGRADASSRYCQG